ncbi:hypothetical protein [Micromonospora sp. NPDC023888]|uniref:hypothetical protein n=1 Tax=Micromonospora sp. NPDC023888 TaxID=3155607 RepID=UPI0033CC88A1
MPRGIDALYTDFIFKETGHLATWLPTKLIRVGDVGALKGALLAPEFRVDLDGPERLGNVLDRLEISTPDSVEVNVKASGESPTEYRALAKDDAGVSVVFRRRGAVLAQFGDYCESSIEDVRAARRKLASLLTSGDAEPGSLLVTSVFSAMHLSVMIANRPMARMEFRSPRGLGDHSRPSGLPGLFGDLEPVHRSGMATVIIGATGQTPLFAGVRHRANGGGIEQIVLGDRGTTAVTGILDHEDPRFEYVGLR